MSKCLLKLKSVLPLSMAWGAGVFFALASRHLSSPFSGDPISGMIGLGFGICFLCFILYSINLQVSLISLWKDEDKCMNPERNKNTKNNDEQ